MAKAPAVPVTEESQAASPTAATVETEGMNLDEFVGTWQFIGESGPWGEGVPIKLERAGNLIIGEAVVEEMYDYRIKLKLAPGNGELLGESTTTYTNEPPTNMAISMELNPSKNTMTVKWRCDDGSWMMGAVEKQP